MTQNNVSARIHRAQGTELTRRNLLRQAGLAAGAAASLTGVTGHQAHLVAGSASQGSRSASAFQESPSGDLTYASVREIFTFDPLLVNTTEEMGLMQHVCEPLVRLDATLEVVPHLAKSWEAVDPLTWQFTLNEGVKFHNGEPFNAEAVKFSIDTFREVGEAYRWYYLWPGEIPEVEIVDDVTVLLKSSQTITTTPRNLVMLPMLPPGAGSKDGFGEHPIGTGPFVFVEHQQGVHLELNAFPEYWSEPARVQRLIYRAIADPSARMVAIQTGEVDIAASIPPDLIPVLEAASGPTVHQVPGVRIAHYPFNFRNPDSPVADVRVRQALTYAIDGENILRNILAGAGEPLPGPVPSILFAAADLGGYPPYDREKAKQLLQEAGYPEGHELTLIFSAGEFIKDREVTEAIQGQLAESGVSVRLEELEGGAYTERRKTPDWDIAVNGFSTQNGDPGYFLTWATSDPTTFGYNNEATKEVIAKTGEITNEEDRKQQLIEAQTMYWEDIPYLWGFTQTETVAISDRIRDVQLLSNGWIMFDNAQITE